MHGRLLGLPEGVDVARGRQDPAMLPALLHGGRADLLPSGVRDCLLPVVLHRVLRVQRLGLRQSLVPVHEVLSLPGVG